MPSPAALYPLGARWLQALARTAQPLALLALVALVALAQRVPAGLAG